MRPLLPLFDIDLTLIRTGGAGLRAMADAFREYTGIQGEVLEIRPDGRTDPHIVPELFAINGCTFHPDDYEPFLALYLDRLTREAAGPKDWVLLPGVLTLLDTLSAMPDVCLSLVTGNDERGARIKLSAFDLGRYFHTGAYGSDSARRSDLVELAIRRAAERSGRRFDRDRVVVIGDSVHDVRCAFETGVRCLAVTTGRTCREELVQAGPCAILPDLSDTQEVLRLLGV